mmetsp:Transcript_84339/g.220277  ORF Transcript_84339/g.220277 Transcript_84339/m.220277 type:complete len:254 (-) Transcript_84339:647-1408(-)
MRSSPQNISRSSERLKATRHSKGNVSLIPARHAATCAETPVSNQNLAAWSANSRTFSTVTATLSPPGQSGAPLRPVSRKQAPTADTYCSNEVACCAVAPSGRSGAVRKRSAKSMRSACALRHAARSSGVASAASPAPSSRANSARAPTSSPAQPLPGRGRLAWPSDSPSTSAKNSSASGRGTMKPSRSAWPIRRPRNRKRFTTSSFWGPSTKGFNNRPLRHSRYCCSEEPSSSTHIGRDLFTARSWRAWATST